MINTSLFTAWLPIGGVSENDIWWLDTDYCGVTGKKTLQNCTEFPPCSLLVVGCHLYTLCIFILRWQMQSCKMTRATPLVLLLLFLQRNLALQVLAGSDVLLGHVRPHHHQPLMFVVSRRGVWPRELCCTSLQVSASSLEVWMSSVCFLLYGVWFLQITGNKV